MEFATILNEEARELEAAGVDVIQFDEPSFNVFFDDVRDWGVAALDRAAEGLGAGGAETAVHIYYGYGIAADAHAAAHTTHIVAKGRASSRPSGIAVPHTTHTP